MQIGETARCSGSSPEEDIEEAYHCTSADCGRLFLAQYRYESKDGAGTHRYKLVRLLPVEFAKPILPQPIEELSRVFVETYSQALQAESLGLAQLTGIGLRKALEFLVKDFAIKENPEDEEAVKVKLLGQCIKDHVEDPSVQAVIQRAAWLGNDETHYVRRWLDKDISDLKILVRLVVNRIESKLLEEQYLAEMPDDGPPKPEPEASQ